MSQFSAPTAEDLQRSFTDPRALRMPLPQSRAAVVAMIFRVDGGVLKVCLGRRAMVAGDPWSGDLAFPGGKPESGDDSLHDTAARETFEEVGLALPPESLIGDLGHTPAHSSSQRPLATYPLVYLIRQQPPPLRLDHELVDVRWVSVPALWDAANWRRFTFPLNGQDYAAVRAMDHYLWGYSLRVLHDFSRRVGRALTPLIEAHDLPRLDGSVIAGTRID